MAIEVIDAAVITINSVDLSDHIEKCTLTITSDPQTYNAFGNSGWQSIAAGGLKSGQLDLDFLQDYASNEVDATLNGIVGTIVTFSVKPDSGATSATNPLYSGSVYIAEYKPIDASPNQVNRTAVSWPTSGAITRATS